MEDNDSTALLDRRAALLDQIRRVDANSFSEVAMAVFAYQAEWNPLYRQFLELLGLQKAAIRTVADIPHLPLGLFKSYRIQTGSWAPERTFTSSGTTGTSISQHLLRSSDWYHWVARTGFEARYGPLQEYAILALLPAYLERQGSSLVYMVKDFIEQSGRAENGFFLYEYPALLDRIRALQQKSIPTLLIGVSFALLDLAEQHPTNLAGVTLMETGGMKGRRRELTRAELHTQLRTAFGLEAIHSEYGMTELLSQAYSPGKGLFFPSPTMRVRTREITDPFSAPATGRTGALNIQDLANLDTISFLATDDLGRVYEDGSFEVLGRLDNSDVRGCNLLLADIS